MFTGACEKKDGLLDPVAISITVTPNPQTLQVGATQQFTAVGRDFAGATVGITPVWSVVAGGGTISASGLFTAGNTPGTFASTVKATSGDVSGFATVTVTAAPLATITVTPNPATLAIGGLQTFTAVGRDTNGNVVAITPVWSVVNGGGAINASTGAFTAGNVTGTFANTVRATSGAISGTATVIVTPGPAATLVVTPNPVTLEAGSTQQFTAVARDAAGNVVTVTPVWSVVNGGGAIGSGTGMFTAGNVAGTFANTVRATVGALSATATVNVTVTPPPVGALASITITPNPATLEVHASAQFTAVGRDANGNVVPIVPTWSVVNGGGAIGASSGHFAAGANAGTFTNTIRATSGGIEAFATVIVTPSTALARIIVTPNPATMGVGANQQFTAVGQDISGNPVAITPVWTVVNGGGTINAASGRFTAGMILGTFTNTVRATSGSISGTATVIVTPGPLATIVVTPNPDTVNANATQQFTAVGRDASGNVVAITPVWSVINGGGSINAGTGLFTAGGVAGTFNNTVQATSGLISGTATVTVVVPPLPPSPFSVLANTAVACTGGTISGDIGTFQGSPLGSITLSSCPQVGTTHVGDPAAVAAYNDFLSTYTALAPTACDAVLSGTLAGVILAPGVYCFDAAATLTGVLTLDGPANGTWLFKIGTTGTGALSGTGFTVTMGGTAVPCNVTWWVSDAATMTDSNLKGNVLTGVGITLTRGTFIGNAWSKTDVTITDTALTGCQ